MGEHDSISESINKLKDKLGQLAHVHADGVDPDAYQSFCGSVEGSVVIPAVSTPDKCTLIFQQGNTSNDFQPEACRFVHSALAMVYALANLGFNKEERIALPNKTTNIPKEAGLGTGVGTDRHINIHIPERAKQAFNDAFDYVFEKIASSEDLQAQYEKAMTLALSGFNNIPHTMSFPEIKMGSGGQLKICLEINNVPYDLAEKLAPIVGKPFGELEECVKPIHSRDRQTEVLPMGKNLKLDVDAPYFQNVAGSVMKYVAEKKRPKLSEKLRHLLGYGEQRLPGF